MAVLLAPTEVTVEMFWCELGHLPKYMAFTINQNETLGSGAFHQNTYALEQR